MDRATYNECMRPYITGSKPKEQRRLDFCVGAKICSSKASTREQAEEICRQPKPVKVKRQEVPTVKITPPVKPCADISPMGDWLAGNQEGECRACLLPPVIQWYREELEQNNPELVKDVDSAVQSGDPALITWTFDSIKTKVSEKLKERLKEFDCHAQLHKGEK